MADESLHSVIDNLVRNAVIHGKTDRISVDISNLGNTCDVRIADYGVGISDDIKGKIFEEGFTYGETGQTGLGLHIVKKAMETYGGQVYVEDNKPKGTAFILKLKAISEKDM
jgi:signal transduction histidine kinase